MTKRKMRGIKQIFLVLFIYYKFHSMILNGCKASCLSAPRDIEIRDMRSDEGEILSCIDTIGLEMCVQSCVRTSGCSFVNYDTEELQCELMASYEGPLVSNLTVSNGEIFVKMLDDSTNKICGPVLCGELSMCMKTTSGIGKYTCQPIEDKCCKNHYLVTGRYGVDEESVSFSSSVPELNKYQLDSTEGWWALTVDSQQWVLVNFQRRRIVLAIVIQSRSETQWVTSYVVDYLGSTGEWLSIRDSSGIKMNFQGNQGTNDIAISYLPHPIRTRGIKIKPETFYVWITMRFDILGC